MAGKTGSSQVRRVSPRAARARRSSPRTCPGSSARTRCSWRSRPTTRRATPARWWSSTATPAPPPPAPIARDIMIDVLTRDPATAPRAAAARRRTRAAGAAGREEPPMSLLERRLIRETSFGLTGKLLQVSWLYVLLLCALAGVGYAALYSAGGGSAEPYATRHVLRFALRPDADARHRAGRHPLHRAAVLAGLCRWAWRCWCWCCAWAMSARARSAGSNSAACSGSRASS